MQSDSEVGLYFHSPFRFFALCTLACGAALGASDQPAADNNVSGKSTASWEHANSPTESDLLVRAASANQDLYSTLQSFVCNEQIERYGGRASAGAGRHLDTVTAKLSMENGSEHYSDLRRKNHPLAGMSSLEGAWSEGEFGTLLKQTEQLLRTQQARFKAWDKVDDAPAAIYTFKVSAAESPWNLNVAGQQYVIPFRTEVWISRESGEILQIVRSSTEMPASLRIRQIRWGVTLSRTNLNGKMWLLPSGGEYAVLYGSTDRLEWNAMTFSDYHRYGSEVALRFDQ